MSNRRPNRPVSSLLALPLYLAISVLWTWPLSAWFAQSIPAGRTPFDPGPRYSEAPGGALILGWDSRALVQFPSQIFSLPIFYPEPRALTYTDHLIGEALVAAPAIALTGTVAAGYNLVFLLSFATSAWFTYRLVRLLGVGRAGALLCGFLYTFSSYRYANLDLLNLLQTQFLPLGLFFAVRYLQRWKLKDALGVALVGVAQVYFGWYYAYFLALGLAVLFAFAVVAGLWRPPSGHPRWLLLFAGLALVAVLPVTWPYVVQRFAFPEFRRSLGESALYSADALDYFKAHFASPWVRIFHFPTGPQSYWPGTIAAILGAIGARAAWRKGSGNSRIGTAQEGRRAGLATLRARFNSAGWAGYFLLLGIIAFLFSLGPILHVGGHRFWIPLPEAALYYLVPGWSGMRAPSRLAVLALLGAVVLAGFGYERLRGLWNERKRRRSWWPAVAAALFLVSAWESWIAPLSLLTLPTPSTIPAAYRWLASRPGRDPLLELPVVASDGDEDEGYGLRQYGLLFHGKPRIDGSSGFVSKRYRAFRRGIQSFPFEPGWSQALAVGAHWVLIHYGDYPVPRDRDLALRVASEPRLRLRAQFGTDVLYEVAPP